MILDREEQELRAVTRQNYKLYQRKLMEALDTASHSSNGTVTNEDWSNAAKISFFWRMNLLAFIFFLWRNRCAGVIEL